MIGSAALRGAVLGGFNPKQIVGIYSWLRGDSFRLSSTLSATGAAPPACSLTGTLTTTIGANVRVECTGAGSLGAAIIRYSLDGGTTWTSGVTSASSVALGGTGISLSMPAGTYATDNAWTCNIDQWTDLSGVSGAWTQSTVINMPIPKTSAINGKTGIDFSGATRLFSGPNMSALTGGEILIVAKIPNDPPTVGRDGLINMGTGVSGNYPFSSDGVIYDNFGTNTRKTTVNPTPSLTSPFTYRVVSTSSEWTSAVNGSQIFTTATNTVGFPVSPVIGSGANPSDATICEIVITSAKMSTGDRSNLYSYTLGRYGV